MRDPYFHKNFQLFVAGVGLAGVVTDVDLPGLTMKTEDFRGAGMAGDIEIPQGLEKIEIGWNMAGLDPHVIENFGLADSNGVRIRLQMAEQSASGTVRPIEVEAEGFVKTVEPGTLKPGEKAPVKDMFSCRFYKLSIDGTPKIEIDLIKGTHIINGVDQNEAIRNAIGA